MKKVIVSKKKDTVVLKNKHEFSVFTTITKDKEDYHIRLEFDNTSDFETIKKIFHYALPVKIQSGAITQYGLDTPYFIIYNMLVDDPFKVILDGILEKKKQTWEDCIVTIGGKEIKGIKSVNYTKLIEISNLESELNIALMNEDYELCAELRDKISKLKSSHE